MNGKQHSFYKKGTDNVFNSGHPKKRMYVSGSYASPEVELNKRNKSAVVA